MNEDPFRGTGFADTVWADLVNVLQGNGAAERKWAGAGNDPEQERQRWQAVLDDWLLQWAQEPSVLEDDGIVPPTEEIIQLACQLAKKLRDAGVSGPHGISATGDGGIVFVCQEGPLFSSLEIDADRSIELAIFRDSRLVSRQRLR